MAANNEKPENPTWVPNKGDCQIEWSYVRRQASKSLLPPKEYLSFTPSPSSRSTALPRQNQPLAAVQMRMFLKDQSSVFDLIPTLGLERPLLQVEARCRIRHNRNYSPSSQRRGSL